MVILTELKAVKTKDRVVLHMRLLLSGIILLYIFQEMQVECQRLKLKVNLIQWEKV